MFGTNAFGGSGEALPMTAGGLPVEKAWLAERIVENAGEAVLFADTDGVIRLWNDAAEEIFGYPADEAIGETLDIIVPAEYRQAHWAGYDTALERGGTTSPPVARSQVPARHANGHRITIETSGARVVTENGDAIGVFNLIRDVTDAARTD